MSRFNVLLKSNDRVVVYCDEIRIDDGVVTGIDIIIDVASGVAEVALKTVVHIPDAIGFYKDEK